MTVTVKYYNDEGEEVETTFPSVMEVCTECNGEGFVLCEGMRGVAYSAEDFERDFDDEERQQYMTRGGIYDQVCPVCHGKNVVPIVDEERLTDNQKVEYNEYLASEEARLQSQAEDRATMRAECGYRE
jgi:RecJ-like exonuclease